MTKQALVLGLCLLGACGKKGGDAPKVEIDPGHVAAVNAAIPADLKGKLEFELATVEGMKKGESFKLAAPKGWKAGGPIPGTLKPADSDGFESKAWGKTQLKVGHDCNGACEKKDWAAVSDKVYFSQFTGGTVQGKVVKDDKGTNRRTLVFERKVSDAFPEHDVAVDIITAWWDPEGPRYYVCSAELGAPAKGLVAAFELACSKVSAD
jgi:hypothetical protein